MESSKAFGKPTNLSQRPRPPTPGPGPGPLPPGPFPPSPPPSPHNSVDLGMLVPASATKPSEFSRSYPEPPPSPPGGGGGRQPPVAPRPNVPTPPPSPHTTINPLVLSTASELAVSVVQYLSTTSWANGGHWKHENIATQGTPMLGSGFMSSLFLESSHDFAKRAKTPYIDMARYEVGPRKPLAHMIGA